MEIHFYYTQSNIPANVDICYGWMETNVAIATNVEIIHTTQMGVLSTSLFECGYKIFVHGLNNDTPYEIKLGKNNCTGREIRMNHNLFKLWQAGEFYW